MLYQDKEVRCFMCYNCGCGMPDEDHGNPKNITTKTFVEAASASDQPPEDAKKNTKELLETEAANPPAK